MKIIFIFSFCFLVAAESYSQQFKKYHSIDLPDSLQAQQVEWADINNDGILDVIVSAHTSIDSTYLFIVKGDTLQLPTAIKNTQVIKHDSFSLFDYNRDNKIDVLISGVRAGVPVVCVYMNQGNFVFNESVLPIPAFERSQFADLDSDGRHEWIVSGDNGASFFNIYKGMSDGTWHLANDTFKIRASALEIIDADGNGRSDIFISGVVDADSIFTGILLNNGKMSFTPWMGQSWKGISAIADINADGIFDIAFSGRDKSNQPVLKNFLSGGHGAYTFQNITENSWRGTTPFTVDLNSDGVNDFNFSGLNLSNDTINVIRYTNGADESLPMKFLRTQRFGDVEHDGDLDLVQLIVSDHSSLQFFRNECKSSNKGSLPPSRAIAVPIFNRAFFYWDGATDDSTPLLSLTYDVLLENNTGNVLPAEFDILKLLRLTPSRGNNGSNNFMLLDHFSMQNLGYAIQSVDNAFHTGRTICKGPGGNGGPCPVTIAVKKLPACQHEVVHVDTPHEVKWFSFADGFLGSFSKFEQRSEKPDTLFFVDPTPDNGCFKIQVMLLQINNDTTRTEKFVKAVCEGASFNMSVEPEWSQVTWSSQLRGSLGTNANISYNNATASDTLSVLLKSNEGCTVLRKTAIRISIPVVTVANDHYKIMKGDSVHLSAQGAAAYVWSPSTGLNKNNIANPSASPEATTQYTVIGTDSIGCTGTATLTVEVEEMGFVPTLFTPNDDGKNDHFKVFGVGDVQDFSLAVFNREGRRVYKTNSVAEASAGWDGTFNGVAQPGGVYFWKVGGRLSSGGKLLLNGKDSGSVVLIR